MKIKVGNTFALIDVEDYEVVNQYRWHLQQYKNSDLRYARHVWEEQGHQRSQLMHSLILPEFSQIDHIDHNGLNNCRSNLRETNSSLNGQNKRKAIGRGKSQYKGLTWITPEIAIVHGHRNMWCVKVSLPGRKVIEVGHFKDEIEAAQAYDEAALKYFGEYACVNFPRCTK